jgi:D-alanyl-D-alanine carboxypeptidase (penicillin-binding protein 5/6)
MKWMIGVGILLWLASVEAKQLEIETRAKAALLINADNGVVLYQKNAETPLYPASITKIATATYILEEKKPDLAQTVTVGKESVRYKPINKEGSFPSYWLESDGTKIGLIRDEEISIDALLHALMLASANDAANVLAESLSGSITAFVGELNHYLGRLGCQDTHFTNPHGLHDASHQTTAADLGLIARRALKNPVFRAIVSKRIYHKEPTNKHDQEDFRQLNRLLLPGRYYYPRAIGVKTGYTRYAQNNLVAAAEQNGRTLIAVLLGCEKREDRYIDAKELFEAAFSEQLARRTFFAGSEYVQEVKGAKEPLRATCMHGLSIDYYPAEEPEQLKAQICWEIPSLPIAKGSTVGQLRLIDGNHILHSQPLTAKDRVEGTLWFYLTDWCRNLWK